MGLNDYKTSLTWQFSEKLKKMAKIKGKSILFKYDKLMIINKVINNFEQSTVYHLLLSPNEAISNMKF